MMVLTSSVYLSICPSKAIENCFSTPYLSVSLLQNGETWLGVSVRENIVRQFVLASNVPDKYVRKSYSINVVLTVYQFLAVRYKLGGSLS